MFLMLLKLSFPKSSQDERAAVNMRTCVPSTVGGHMFTKPFSDLGILATLATAL